MACYIESINLWANYTTLDTLGKTQLFGKGISLEREEGNQEQRGETQWLQWLQEFKKSD